MSTPIRVSLTRRSPRGLMAASVMTAAVAIAVPLAAPAQADPTPDATVTATEVADSLRSVSGLLGGSDTVVSTSDKDSASVTSVQGTTVDVPKDPSNGVRIVGTGPSFSVVTPGAASAEDAAKVAPGITAFPAGDGSASAVQATESGGAEMLTVIAGPTSPTTYTYHVRVAEGSKVSLTDDGAAVVADASGAIVTTVPAPVATDAAGHPVRTWFSTEGSSLTQHVEHDVTGVSYPVTADPFWAPMSAYLKCIFGVGVPVGLAAGIVMYFGTAATLNAAYQAALRGSVSAGTAPNWWFPPVRAYVIRVYQNCRYAITY